MRHFEEIAPCEHKTIADFNMHYPVNIAKLTEIIRDVIGETSHSIPENIAENLRIAAHLPTPVTLDDYFFVKCENKHFFTLGVREPNWDHSEIKEL